MYVIEARGPEGAAWHSPVRDRQAGPFALP